MARVLAIAISLLVLLLAASAATGAGIDAMDLALKQQFSYTLSWQNIEGPPAWVTGPEPEYNVSRNWHEIRLQPNQSVRIRMPAYACLRLEQMTPATHRSRPEVFLSNGSGMWQATSLKTVKDGRMLYVCPESPDPLYCRIDWPERAKRDAVLALFVSRDQAASDISPYRDLVAVENADRKILTGKSGKRRFRRLEANATTAFEIQGPSRVKIESRLLYPGTAPQRRQRYRLLCRIDDQNVSPLKFETRPAMDQVFRLNGSPITLGRLESRHIEIPKGKHTVRLSSSRDLLFRVLSQQRPDYLVPKLNAPDIMPSDLNPSIFLSSQFDELSVADICEQPYDLPTPYWEQAALCLARDNRKPGGGLLGPTLLQSYASKRPDAPEVRERAEQIYLRHTFYRDLLPRAEGRQLQQTYHQFISPQLAPLEPRQTVAAMQHRKALANALSSALFTPLPPKEDRLVYSVPKRNAPTRLQVITCGHSEPFEFMIKIGDQEPKRLQVKPGTGVPLPDRRVQLPEIGLAMLQTNSSRSEAGPFAAVLSGNRAAESLEQASTTTLPLPAEAERVTLHALSATSGLVALRYRKAGTYNLTERQYLQKVKRLKAEEGLYRDLLEAFQSGEGSGSAHVAKKTSEKRHRAMAQRDLVNDWVPLFRMLQSRAALFSSPVSPLPTDHFLRSQPEPAPNSDKLERLREKAKAFQANSHWLPALELWCQIAAASTGQHRHTAVFSIVSCLENRGEQYLAEMMLRGLYLYPFGDSPRQMSDTAFERLQAIYEADRDYDRLSLLYAAEAMRDPSSKTLQSLCRVLAAEDQPRMAISLGLVLPRQDQPLPVMLGSALRLNWKTLYSDLVSRIEETEDQSFWRALERIQEGDYPKANRFLDRAGGRGRQLGNRLNQALSIREQLGSDDLNTRVKGILAWENWQGNQTGPYYWQNSPRLITEHSGGRTLDNKARDLEFQGYLAQPGKPAKIEVYGPAVLRLKCRPLHSDKEEAKPFNGWVTVEGSNTRRYMPVTNNRPAPGLRIVGSERRPGTSEMLEFSVQAGPHAFSVQPGKRGCLVRVSVRRPQSSLDILPQLSRKNVQTVLSGALDQTRGGPADRKSHWDADASIFIHPNGKTKAYSKAFIFEQIPDARQKKDKVSRGWRQLTARRDTQPSGPEHALAKGELKQALSRCSEQTPASVFQKMTILLRMAETRPSAAAFADARARALFARHPDVNGLDSLLVRLSRSQGMRWRPVDSIYGGQGIRYVQVPRWSSVTPFLRIRKALLGPKSEAEEILSGGQRLVLSRQKEAPGSLKLDLAYGDLPFLPPATLKATYQIDDRPAKNLFFKPGETSRESLKFRLSSGAHKVRVTMSENKVNQFLRVEVPSAMQRAKGPFAGGLKPYKERGYFVATDRAPIRATIEGPTWLRIDKWINGKVTCEYQYVEKGRQQIVLGADKSGKQTLYRLYQRKKDLTQKAQPLQLRERSVDFALLPPPCLQISGDLDQPLPECEGDDSYGRHEDGTWSTGVRASRRRSLFEDFEGGDEPERFFEVFGAHRFYQPSKHRYFHTRLLTRCREFGGPTLGIEEEVAFYPRYVPFHFRLQGQAFAQNPASQSLGYFGQGQTEWLGRAETIAYQNRHFNPKTYHRPSVSLFGRYLSLRKHSAYESKRIDQDVYTPYKADHKAGLSVSERLVHRPWLDTIWSAGTELTSNEKHDPLNPDNVDLWCQWNQLLSPFQVKLGYRTIHYFSDQDRDSALWRHFASLEFKFDWWRKNQERLELKSGLKVGLDRENEYSAWAGLVWHFSEHQDLQDFKPGDPSFQTLKTRQLQQKP
ncbi:MAG: hypothetical protein V5B78_04530 [Desulfohalobiaceae bacterium]